MMWLMEAVWGYIVSIAVFTFVVLIHELGHYAMYKACGLTIPNFSVGFGRKLFSFHLPWKPVAETEWSLRLIMVGGFVRLMSRELYEYWSEEEQAEIGNRYPALIDEQRWYDKAGPCGRFFSAFGGPGVNILAAIATAWLLFYCQQSMPLSGTTEVTMVVAGSAAEEMALQKGDRILRINGEEAGDPDKAQDAVSRALKSGRVELVVLRDGAEVKSSAQFDPGVDRQLGVWLDMGRQRGNVSMIDAANAAVVLLHRQFRGTAKFLAGLFIGKSSPKKLTGPIGIVHLGANASQHGALGMISFFLALNIGLAFFNLLPIPLLDGSHMVGALWDGATGRPVPQQLSENAKLVAAFLLLGLFAWTAGSDIWRLISG